MRWIRVSIYVLPLVLAVVAIHFLGTLGDQELAQPDSITFAISTEPVGVDPLTAQDPVSEEIESLLFDSLLGRGPGMELEGHLAESWSHDAVTRLYFGTEQRRERGWGELDATRDEWDSWGLREADLNGDELNLSFRDSRAQGMRQVLAVIPQETLAPITSWRLRALHSARQTVEHFRDTAREGWQIRRIWSHGSELAEFESAGHSPNFERELRLYVDSNPQLELELEKLGERWFLVEPRLTVHLRSGVRWHDGRAFSVADVLHSIELARSSTLQPLVVSGLLPIQAFEARGPLTFRVKYRDLFSPQLEVWERLRILPAHAWHAYSPRIPELPLVGTGPFCIRQWKSGAAIVLERNPDYFRGLPSNGRIVYEPVLENRLRRALFQIGVIDSYEADPGTYRHLVAQGAFQLARSAPTLQTLVAWNLDVEVLRDLRVRQALAWAIDADRLIDGLLGGNAQWSDQIFHPDSGVGATGIEGVIGYNRALADAMLDEAGWDERRFGGRYRGEKALSFQLTYASGDDFQRALARELQRQWAAINVQVKLRPVSFGALTSIQSGNLDHEAVLLTQPLSYFRDHYGRWHSSQTGRGQGNFARLRDQEVDRTLEAIRQTFDPEEQGALMGRLQQQIYAQQPGLFLFLRDSARVFQHGRLRVVDGSRRGGPVERKVGENRVSLTHDLAWWVKAEPGIDGIAKVAQDGGKAGGAREGRR